MTVFIEELDQWGPGASPAASPGIEEARRYCRGLATTHYENFPVVSWLLPRDLHQHFYNIYAYCRWADDLADEISDKERSLELLSWWLEELRDCYSGQPRHPVFVALAETVRQFEIPAEPFEDLVSAFQQDQRIHEYETFDQLQDYCRRSANPVGRLVLYLCGEYSEQNVLWSDSVCTGLQLANFWQDVARDHKISRIYLPVEDRERFGYSREDLQAQRTNEAFLKLMEFEVGRAEQFLRDGLPLVDEMPGRLQIDIELFIRGGLKILEKIRRVGYRVWDIRPVVKKQEFAWLFCRCTGRALWRRVVRPSSKSHNRQ